MHMLAQRQIYKVTPESPHRLSNESVGLGPKHLILVHDLSSCEHAIVGAVAKVSLYKLVNVTLHLNVARILSSLLEISHCRDVTIHFGDTVPSIIQIDADIHNLAMQFSTCEPNTFIVAPRSQGTDVGLSEVSVVVPDKNDAGGSQFVFIDAEGRINNELLISGGGRKSEQYKITHSVVDGVRRWTMEPVGKLQGGIPVLN